MGKAHTVANIQIGGQPVDVKAYHGLDSTLRVGLVWQDETYFVLSEMTYFFRPEPRLKEDEFIVTDCGGNRIYLKEVRKTNIFIDTGRRLQFNNNLWGEVWRLKPEHLALLTEKEKKNEEARSKDDSKC